MSSTDGAHFTSYNLSSPRSTDKVKDVCPTDDNGEGGSDKQPTSLDDSDPGSYVSYCAPTKPILLASNVGNQHQGTLTMEFGFTKFIKNGQDKPSAPHGVSPLDGNNSNNVANS